MAGPSSLSYERVCFKRPERGLFSHRPPPLDAALPHVARRGSSRSGSSGGNRKRWCEWEWDRLDRVYEKG